MGAPGKKSRRMKVTVQQDIAPGSIVTVQYPLRKKPSVGGRALPRESLQVSPEVNQLDQRQSALAWSLYGLGCISFICLPPLALVLWIVAACTYYLHGRRLRSKMSRSSTAAYVSFCTCLLCTTLLLGVLGVVCVSHFASNPHEIAGGPPQHVSQHVSQHVPQPDSLYSQRLQHLGHHLKFGARHPSEFAVWFRSELKQQFEKAVDKMASQKHVHAGLKQQFEKAFDNMASQTHGQILVV